MEPFIETDIASAVHRIAQALASPANSLPGFGYAKGVLGQVLFWSYYAYFADNQTSQERAAQERAQSLLVESIQRVTQPYTGHSFSKELVEFGIFLEYARANDLLAVDTNELLTGPDRLLATTMTNALDKRDFDPYTGALGPGYYFLSRAASHESARQAIDQLVVGLHRIAVTDEVGHLYWPSQLFGDNRIYLGLSHGSAAILVFLCRAIELEIQVDLAASMIHRAVGFLLVHQQNYQQVGAFFPDIVQEKPAWSRLGLCYGDLGIAYSLLRAGQVLNDYRIEQEGVAVFSFSATRQSPADSGIRDASILYGASGAALLFDKAYQLTGQLELDEAARYWYERIPDFAVHNNPTAGYQGVFNQHFPHTNVGFMEGIAGIGATLMKGTERDNYSFDELIWLL